ncbi:MAG: AsmA-like C-terminal region [Prosthecobacter sp.]|nr:AsmA-like C-terminal region [Prosthecobacter sp.]
MTHASKSPPRRKLRIALITIAVLGVLVFGAYHWLVNKAQTTLRERLSERGLALTYNSVSWSPWGGITLQQAALKSVEADKEPLIEISALHVDLLWRESWRERAAITHWHISDATLTLRDEAGPVSVEHLTTDVSLGEDKIQIMKFEATHGVVTIAVAGDILAAAKTEKAEPVEAFKLNLKPVRSVLNMLDFKGSGSFGITGKFMVDLRSEAVLWSADLDGHGKTVELSGVPMQQVDLDAQLSQAELTLNANVVFVHGTAAVKATRADWDKAPLILSGTVTDSAGRKDEFNGEQQGGKDTTVTISRLTGNANLVELARNIPAAAAALPQDVKVNTFPDIIAKGFVWHGGSDPPEWSLESLQLRKAAALVVTVREHPLVIEQLLGSLSYHRRSWHFNELRGKMLGGGFSLDADYDGKKLSNANVTMQTMHLADLTPWVGKLSAKLEDADLSFAYRGTIGNDPSNSTGSGSLDLTHAPVVHVPLLDSAYRLFPKILSKENPQDEGEVRVKFVMSKGVAMVEPIKGLGQSIVVTARGTVDLNKRTVDGHARANVRGIVGVIISPISVAFMEMQVRGPFDDIKVSPLGLIGAAKSVVKNTVKLSSTVVREGVSVPFEALGMFRSTRGKAAE